MLLCMQAKCSVRPHVLPALFSAWESSGRCACEKKLNGEESNNVIGFMEEVCKGRCVRVCVLRVSGW